MSFAIHRVYEFVKSKHDVPVHLFERGQSKLRTVGILPGVKCLFSLPKFLPPSFLDVCSRHGVFHDVVINACLLNTELVYAPCLHEWRAQMREMLYLPELN